MKTLRRRKTETNKHLPQKEREIRRNCKAVPGPHKSWLIHSHRKLLFKNFTKQIGKSIHEIPPDSLYYS